MKINNVVWMGLAEKTLYFYIKLIYSIMKNRQIEHKTLLKHVQFVNI